jgi:hypothetical protein
VSRLTRRNARQWLAPIRKAFAEMKDGEVDSIRGYAVTRIDSLDEYARVDWAINGFVALIERLIPGVSCAPMRQVSKKLAAGVPITQAEIDDCLELTNRCESALIKVPREAIRDAVLTEQIGIEMEQLGLKEAA